MSIATQRGNSALMKKLQQGAKSISVNNPVVQNLSFDKPAMPSHQVLIPETGAASTIKNMGLNVPVSHMNPTVKPITENFSEKMFLNHLLESVSTLGSTKEYFNAINSMFTLYAMGQLTEGVLDSLSRGDLREIKGIVKEFSNILDSY